MGWLSREAFEEFRRKALALTDEQRDKLTWEEAAKIVPHDTLCLAQFSGIQKSGQHTPWEAVVMANRL